MVSARSIVCCPQLATLSRIRQRPGPPLQDVRSRGIRVRFFATSRSREVSLACESLRESINAGDQAWFERVLSQLRQVLHESTASPSKSVPELAQAPHEPWVKAQAAGAKPSATARGQEDHMEQMRDADRSVAPVADEEPWMRAYRLLQAAASAKPSTTASSTAKPMDVNRPQKDQREKAQDAAWAPSPPEAALDEEPWARALRLLQAAAGAKPSAGTAKPQDASIRQDQTEEARDAAWAERSVAPLFAAETARTEEDDAEPSWARALRMLNEAALQPGKEAHRDDFTRHGEERPGDRQRTLRRERYAQILEHAQVGKDTPPGGSVPRPSFRPRAATLAAAIPKPPERRPPPTEPIHAIPPAPPRSDGIPPAPPRSASRPRAAPKETDPMLEAVGKGNLVSSLPSFGRDREELQSADLRKEDFKWSEHEFNDGEKENKRVLRGFKAEFKKLAAQTPDGLRDPGLLTKALDLALACVKNYDLDAADAIYRRCIGECRRRGLPWDVKCIQDMATLRCKQNRQADAAELLEELATLAPPHPATFINLGTVYNQLKQYDKAEVWFKQAINLKGGEPEREDLWYLGICKKNQGKFSEGLDLLQQALELFLIHEPDHPVTLAKLHSSVGGCLHDMGRAEEARDQFQKAYDLYVQSVGKRSPLFCSAAEGLAKALKECNQLEDSFDALVEAFDVHATQDAVHPTPLFENLEMALQLHDMNESLALKRMVPFIRAGIANLDSRGMAADGNAGLVMSRGAKLIKRVIKSASGNEARELTDEAGRLLSTGKELLRASHEAGEADIMHEVLEAEMMLKSLDTAAS